MAGLINIYDKIERSRLRVLYINNQLGKVELTLLIELHNYTVYSHLLCWTESVGHPVI